MNDSGCESNNRLSSALAKLTKLPALSSGILDDAAKVIVEKGCAALNTNRVGMWSLAKNAEWLNSIAYYDASKNEHAVQNDFNISKRTEYVKLLSSERLIVINDTKEPNVLSDVVDEYGPNICAMLDAPIRMGGELVGVVCIEQDRCPEFPDKREWTMAEQNFASSLADLMALAMESANRLTQMRRTESMMRNLPGMVYQ
jgi:GAF domain-containing protein